MRVLRHVLQKLGRGAPWTRCLGASLGALFLGTLAADAQTTDRVRPFTKVDGWRIATLVQSGRTSGCVAVSGTVDGTTLVIGYGARWWLGLNNSAWHRNGNRSLTVDIRVDGKSVSQATALQRQRMVVMEVGEEPERLAALMAGQTISFVSPLGRTSFSLKGSAKAAAAVTDCARNGGRPPVAAAQAAAPAGGSFGAAGAATASLVRRLASRAQTLELATTYLAKLGTPYTLLEPSDLVLKNFPVNWVFADGGVGGMVIYSGANANALRFFDEFVADNARLCKGNSALQRQEPVTNEQQRIIRYSAVGHCEETERAYMTDFTVLAGPDLLVAILNIGAVGSAGMKERQEHNRKWSL